jgi:precorrin-4 C11-methyltransferase
LKPDEMFQAGVVYFAGAGPGDAALLTLKTKALIECADVILYAGSLINPRVLDFARKDAALHDTAKMNLDEQAGLMAAAARAGKVVARLHTGDPAIFGAMTEQMQALQQAGVPYTVIPGVSSAFAAAAALGIEYTLPEITQTVILTRLSGRTPVPPLENLRSLAAHRSSLVIFLSTGLLNEVVTELTAAGYSPETPIALVYRASWADERVVRGTLANIASLVEIEELTHQGLIIVSPALDAAPSTPSHLYSGFQQTLVERKGVAIVTLTAPAVELGRSLLEKMPKAVLYLPARFSNVQGTEPSRVHPFQESIRQVLQSAFQKHQALICILAAGIVMRELAPLLQNKHSDPAVVVMDAEGKFAVSLLSGHEGGANQLARRTAALTGGQAVITTASDAQEVPALDVLAKQHSWRLHPNSRFAQLMAALVNGEAVGLVVEDGLQLPQVVLDHCWARVFSKQDDALAGGYSNLVVFTCRNISEAFWQQVNQAVVYHLPQLALGIGCNRGTSADEILQAVQQALHEAGYDLAAVGRVATIREKGDEGGLLEVCQKMGWRLCLYERDQISRVPDLPNPSTYSMQALGVRGVAEPAALLAAGSRTLLIEKQKFPNVTVAAARLEGEQ